MINDNSEKPSIIFFPFAGGNQYSFREYSNKLQSNYNVFTVSYPGRTNRVKDNYYDSFDTALTDFENQILSFCDKNTVFFGHSLGGLLAFLFAQYLEEKYNIIIKKIVLSSFKAPSVYQSKNYHLLSDSEFIHSLIKMGGIENSFLDNPELVEYFIPILRNDFHLLSTYKYNFKRKIKAPIHLVYGNLEYFETEQIENWKLETEQFSSLKLVGNHFHIYNNLEQIIELLQT